MKLRYHYYPALLLALAAAAGCGKSENKASATQVAAKVNGDEITVHQVNNILAKNQNIAPEAAARVKREILDRLIDQQLAAQQAIEKKLHRSVSVMQTIEAAKNEILARAYLEQLAAAQPRPTPEEAKRFYVERPELFSQRRMFSLEEFTVTPQPGLAEALQQAAKGRSMQDIAAWLKAKDAKVTESRGVRPAEQIPLDLLPTLKSMKDGEIQVGCHRRQGDLIRGQTKVHAA
jgi:EpsD family peptidyl-prolyl cis-trans isomerase